jgi:Fic family protein
VVLLFVKTYERRHMDWGQFDLDGMMRQRHLDIEARIHSLLGYIKRGRMREEEFWEMLDISWLYHENGLEGVVLTYPEIKSAVDNKIISDVSLLPTYRDIKNQKHCVDTFRRAARPGGDPVDVPMLQRLHRVLMGEAATAGAWRRDIPIHRTYFHEIVAPQHIEPELTALLDDLAQGDGDVHPIERAAAVHHRFMRVFPFSQGSGILGRLLMGYVLQRGNMLPVIVHASDRQRYYEALRGTERDLHVFLAEAMENSLDNVLRFFQGSERVAMRA